MHELSIKTKKKQEIVDITNSVSNIVKKSDIKEGICFVYVPHATCAVIVNENYDPSVREDILSTLNRLIPEHASYKHDTIDNNAHAHIKSTMLSPNVIIPVKNNKLLLGRWQGLALAEFDGPRERKIYVLTR